MRNIFCLVVTSAAGWLIYKGLHYGFDKGGFAIGMIACVLFIILTLLIAHAMDVQERR
jgi:hypothetical protein